MARMTAAETVVECLLAEGITHVFNLSGTQILPILDAADRHPKMRLILGRHEQGAGLMALGYANATRHLALCMSTAGPGSVNLMSGVAAAHKNHTPLIAITGMHELSLHHQDVHQEQDQVAFYQPITKWSVMAPVAEKVPDLLRRAFRIAMSDIPGPVHLAIPIDVQTEQIDFKPMEPWQYRSPSRMDCDLSRMDEIIRLLSEARSPVILAGHEVSDEEATPELVSVAEALGFPVATAVECDAMPYGHALAVGPLGNAGSELAKSITKGADVLLAVGTDFDYRSTQFRFGVISEGTKIIHVSRFGRLLGKTFPAAIAVEGSSRQFLQALTREAKAGRLHRRTVDLVSRKQEWESKRNSMIDGSSRPINGRYVAQVIREIVPEDSILVTDNGHFSHSAIPRQFAFVRPNTYFSPRGYGGIGVGLPYAMGVKLARPNQQVILAAGDGGFMLNVGELETAVREKIKITAVVFNDHGLTSERIKQDKDYGGRYFATEFGDVNFAKIAESMGAYGTRVTEPSDLSGALRSALKQDRIAVVEVVGSPHTRR